MQHLAAFLHFASFLLMSWCCSWGEASFSLFSRCCSHCDGPKQTKPVAPFGWFKVTALKCRWQNDPVYHLYSQSFEYTMPIPAPIFRANIRTWRILYCLRNTYANKHNGLIGNTWRNLQRKCCKFHLPLYLWEDFSLIFIVSQTRCGSFA